MPFTHFLNLSTFLSTMFLPDDAAETEQGRPIQERGIPGSGTPGQYEEAHPLSAAGIIS